MKKLIKRSFFHSKIVNDYFSKCNRKFIIIEHKKTQYNSVYRSCNNPKRHRSRSNICWMTSRWLSAERKSAVRLFLNFAHLRICDRWFMSTEARAHKSTSNDGDWASPIESSLTPRVTRRAMWGSRSANKPSITEIGSNPRIFQSRACSAGNEVFLGCIVTKYMIFPVFVSVVLYPSWIFKIWHQIHNQLLKEPIGTFQLSKKFML